MCKSEPQAKTILLRMLLLGVLIFQVSCGGDEQNPAATASIEPTHSEGTVPLEVRFDVSGDKITQVDWDFGDGVRTTTTGTSSAKHVFTRYGQFTVKAQVRGAEPTTLTHEITVLPDVNLVVTSFAIDRELTPHSLETVSAIIQNIGTSTLQGKGLIHVGYFLSVDPTITVDDIYIGDTSIVLGDSFSRSDVEFGFETLAPRQNYQFDHQLAVKTNIPAGTYYAGAIVDYIDEYTWYRFPRATDTNEFVFPTHVVVPESNEADNVRALPAHQVSVIQSTACIDDGFEADDDPNSAKLIGVGESQVHNFCFDNADWLRFQAVQGSVYKISTFALDAETDTQIILYDRDGRSVLLFHDNLGNVDDETRTFDLESSTPPRPESEIVWEAQRSGTYFIKARTTACDEDLDDHCDVSPDGVGLSTGYTIRLE